MPTPIIPSRFSTQMMPHSVSVLRLGWLASLPVLLASIAFTAFTACVADAGEAAGAKAAAPNPEAEAFFENKVRPLLIKRCYECHSQEHDESQGGLRLDTAPAIARGGSRGAALKPGDAAASLIVRAVEYRDDQMLMPPEEKMPAEEIEILKHWIASGAFDPRQHDSASTSQPEVDWRSHWALQKPQLATAPAEIDPRSQGILDALALARMKQDGIESAAPADRETWLRRVYFDLIGLPPSIDEIERFLATRRPDAAQRVIDHLLARPEFGERWGRHWLDVARYADTVGYTLAGKPPRLLDSEKYRDWTISAYNRDVPYDEQVRLQLAADRIDPENQNGDLDALGFLTVGRRFLRNDDTLDDRIDVVTRGLLGLTVQCARCHDHKFDPVPTMDYYSLVGVFDSSQLAEQGPSKLALKDIDKPHDRRVLLRGQPGNQGPVAPRRFLTALAGDDPPKFTTGSGRMDLAEAIVDPNNPLTRRVMANRVWTYLMGKSFVDTPSDFGVRTEQPRQVALLDDLAVDFANQGDSIKHLIRRIASSYLYRQSSRVTAQQLQQDPDNWYFARQVRRRRDFESLRDSLLLVADQLDLQQGGPPVQITDSPSPPRRTVYAFVDRQTLPSLFPVFDFPSPDAHSPQRYRTTVPQQGLYLLNSPFILEAARHVTLRAASNVAPGKSKTNESKNEDKNESKNGNGNGNKNAEQKNGQQNVRESVQQIFQYVLQRKPSDSELAMAIEFCNSPGHTDSIAASPASTWDYGYGRLNETQTETIDFQHLPVFAENRWGGGKTLPVEKLDWTSLTSTGGHAGDQFAAIRRWTAPSAGTVEVHCQMQHPSEHGNGVRMTILSGGKKLAQHTLANRSASVSQLSVKLDAKQTIDFACDDNGDISHDSFKWTIQIRFKSEQDAHASFDSVADFSGRPDRSDAQALTRIQQLAQVLMLSNEFAFVD